MGAQYKKRPPVTKPVAVAVLSVYGCWQKLSIQLSTFCYFCNLYGIGGALFLYAWPLLQARARTTNVFTLTPVRRVALTIGRWSVWVRARRVAAARRPRAGTLRPLPGTGDDEGGAPAQTSTENSTQSESRRGGNPTAFCDPGEGSLSANIVAGLALHVNFQGFGASRTAVATYRVPAGRGRA